MGILLNEVSSSSATIGVSPLCMCMSVCMQRINTDVKGKGGDDKEHGKRKARKASTTNFVLCK